MFLIPLVLYVNDVDTYIASHYKDLYSNNNLFFDPGKFLSG
jgi:hypothetical protein